MFNYNEFEKWIDDVVGDGLPDETVAVNFNLYEESEDNTWAVQFICADTFDDEDEDWACDEIFSSDENMYIWTEDGGWEKALDTASSNIRMYLEKGRYATKLKKFEAVGVGFVDGDIDLVFVKN